MCVCMSQKVFEMFVSKTLQWRSIQSSKDGAFSSMKALS